MIGRKHALSPAQQREFAELWADRRCTRRQIGRIFGISHATVTRYVELLGLPSRPRGNSPRLYQSAAQIEARMVRMRAAKVTRTRPLTLASAPPYAPTVTATNRARNEQAARQQVERCERYLARETPPDAHCLKRCDCCGGLIAPGQPHAHGSAA